MYLQLLFACFWTYCRSRDTGTHVLPLLAEAARTHMAYWLCPAYGACSCDTVCSLCKGAIFWVGRRPRLLSLHQHRCPAAAWVMTLAALLTSVHVWCSFVCKTRLRAKHTILWLLWRCTCSALRCRLIEAWTLYCWRVARCAGGVAVAVWQERGCAAAYGISCWVWLLPDAPACLAPGHSRAAGRQAIDRCTHGECTHSMLRAWPALGCVWWIPLLRLCGSYYFWQD